MGVQWVGTTKVKLVPFEEEMFDIVSGDPSIFESNVTVFPVAVNPEPMIRTWVPAALEVGAILVMTGDSVVIGNHVTVYDVPAHFLVYTHAPFTTVAITLQPGMRGNGSQEMNCAVDVGVGVGVGIGVDIGVGVGIPPP